MDFTMDSVGFDAITFRTGCDDNNGCLFGLGVASTCCDIRISPWISRTQFLAWANCNDLLNHHFVADSLADDNGGHGRFTLRLVYFNSPEAKTILNKKGEAIPSTESWLQTSPSLNGEAFGKGWRSEKHN